jgi:hypothetical protein
MNELETEYNLLAPLPLVCDSHDSCINSQLSLIELFFYLIAYFEFVIQKVFFSCMVGRDINWINLRWFNLGTGAESTIEMYFAVRGFEVHIIRV